MSAQVTDKAASESDPSSMPNAEAVLKALANETRLRIVNMLRSSDQSLCVCEMVDALQMPEYQVSRHLAALKKAGLVNAEKHATWSYHSPSIDAALVPLWTFLDSTLCGEPYETDLELLRRRLTMRAGNYCVVGFVPRSDLEHART